MLIFIILIIIGFVFLLDKLKPCISNGKTKTRKSIIERNLKKK